MSASPPAFHAFGIEHLLAIALIFALPFLLAAITRGKPAIERAVILLILTGLIANYAGYLIFVRRLGQLSWTQLLPMQMCDWALFVVMVTLLTAHRRWFEVAYFWGIGGTLQAILTPNLVFGFPNVRFISFFVSHGGIIVGVVFLMLTRGLRPYPLSVIRVFAWSEAYFVCALTVDHLTQVNYGFLLHKPEAFSLLSYLSDFRPLYLLQMQGLALVFFAFLYAPFTIYDSVNARRPVPGTARD